MLKRVQTVSEQLSDSRANHSLPNVPPTAAGPGAARLAQFFPGASPVRLPVRVMAGAGEADTVIEFGTAREVLFVSALPVDFGERVRVRNSDGSFDTEVEVVALQFENGRTAVAARFIHDVTNWIVKP